MSPSEHRVHLRGGRVRNMTSQAKLGDRSRVVVVVCVFGDFYGTLVPL